MLQIERFILSLLATLACVSCGSGSSSFKDTLKSYGYFAYQTPLHEAGTGTLIGGNPNSFSIVAHQQTCFPDEIDGIATDLRMADHSSLPTKQHSMVLQVNTDSDLKDALNLSDPRITLAASYNQIQNVKASFKGVHVEYIDSIRLSEFIQSKLSKLCRDYLQHVGFIIQAIKVDELRYSFHSKDMQKLKLNQAQLEKLISLPADLDWQWTQQWELVIKEPRYVGYQLGRLKESDDHLVLMRSTMELNGRYKFDYIGQFSKHNIAAESMQEPSLTDFYQPLKQIFLSETY